MDVTRQEDLDNPPTTPATPQEAQVAQEAHSGKPASVPARAGRFASRYAVIGVWVAMIGVYAVAEPGLFLTKGTFQTIFGSQQALVFLTMALLCTVSVGEFVDLSVPAVFGFSATILPVLVVEHGWGVWPAAAVAVLGALVVGVINGLLVVVVGVNTIVVTLGMSTFLGGISLWMSHLNTVSGLPTGFSRIALYSVAGLPISFYYGVVLVGGFTYLLAFTPLGRHIRFVGANREVSRLSGIRVNRIRFGSFVASGALSGVGAVITVAALGGYNPTTSDALLLPTFASVFLGTAVIEPGRFNPIGTLVGIYFLETGILGLQLLGLEAWVSSVFYGGVLVAAVTVSTLLRRRSP
ncbi:ABC transporter permease [Streptomyces sp. NBC_01262]|uniref:ABC transporter permease n=1 Tax=Streptomyces sp. NBC_01262 TaxID=2903803 RepID=UPI002E337A46|nr:ABC transporter permease [Streptomyces sp. NBC_01262]